MKKTLALLLTFLLLFTTACTSTNAPIETKSEPPVVSIKPSPSEETEAPSETPAPSPSPSAVTPSGDYIKVKDINIPVPSGATINTEEEKSASYFILEDISSIFMLSELDVEVSDSNQYTGSDEYSLVFYKTMKDGKKQRTKCSGRRFHTWWCRLRPPQFYLYR
ncbi:MAG: hypothetical protein ACOX3W_02005 [Christensenellaceae bacterium]